MTFDRSFFRTRYSLCDAARKAVNPKADSRTPTNSSTHLKTTDSSSHRKSTDPSPHGKTRKPQQAAREGCITYELTSAHPAFPYPPLNRMHSRVDMRSTSQAYQNEEN
ncbi:hypothetical protein BGZ99_006984 [Dissophora globulifera]|uniref:Uncharacterized protein n=1 Tax=Dissophora globulifera TaxID=979702 RepID=A0A9P6UZM7_9FUNG|nr:hypothetical protein BGZ99_006984 [Dissophora globulifera]